MINITDQLNWYLSEHVMEITVVGAKKNVVHKNMILINAKSADHAYKKATLFGQKAETSYENPKGQKVRIKFRGISKLEEIYEEIQDGAELRFEEYEDVSSDAISKWIPKKKRLQVFITPKPFRRRDPDYRSKEVVEMVIKNLDKKT